MKGDNLSDILSKLTLDSENEDRLSFYLSILRRKGRTSHLISQKAAFIFDFDLKTWIYLELRCINKDFLWGCSKCQNIKTFRSVVTAENIMETYCIHAQAAFMLWDKDKLFEKYNSETNDVVVMNEDPYLAIAHVDDVPSVIHFPRQTKSPNCSEHPGAHKGKKTRCEHLNVHFQRFRDKPTENTRTTRSSHTVPETSNKGPEIQINSNLKNVQTEKRIPNPYGVKIPFLPGKQFQEKYQSIALSPIPFPENLVPDPGNKVCSKHKHKFCSQKMATDRYLIISDKVVIHDIVEVSDSRNSVCRVFYLDTATEEDLQPRCECRLFYTGEEDHLLPISTPGKDHTFHVVSYRLLLDFILLEMTDGTSESGYIKAFNRRRRMLYGEKGKECSKKVWLMAVSDFEHALDSDEEEAFSCEKCPSENNPGDGLDEVHIGDGVSEGTQVDLVPKSVILDSQEPKPSKY